MQLEFIHNGQASGDVASRILAAGGDLGALRPYVNKQGRAMVTINGKSVPTQNASLPHEVWREFDKTVLMESRNRLKLVADLRGRGLEHRLAGGLGTTVFSSQRMSDPGRASISMDGIRRSVSDRPRFDIVNLPIPIVHSEFSFTTREILASRNGSVSLDTTGIEAATRRVSETIEDLHIGNDEVYSFGGASIYGVTTYPNRITYEITSPEAVGWAPDTTVDDFLAMRQLLIDAKQYGPYKVYVGTAWDRYLDKDYSLTGGNNPSQTLRDRLLRTPNISGVETLDNLSGYQIVFVQLQKSTIRSVVGVDFTTVQWQSLDGMELNFKVLASIIPEIREDITGNNCGLVHGSPA